MPTPTTWADLSAVGDLFVPGLRPSVAGGQSRLMTPVTGRPVGRPVTGNDQQPVGGDRSCPSVTSTSSGWPVVVEQGRGPRREAARIYSVHGVSTMPVLVHARSR